MPAVSLRGTLHVQSAALRTVTLKPVSGLKMLTDPLRHCCLGSEADGCHQLSTNKVVHWMIVKLHKHLDDLRHNELLPTISLSRALPWQMECNLVTPCTSLIASLVGDDGNTWLLFRCDITLTQGALQTSASCLHFSWRVSPRACSQDTHS